MAAISDLLSRLRTAIDDVAGDKTAFRENLRRSVYGDQVAGGTTLNFRLNNQRVAVVNLVSTLMVSADGNTFAPPATEDDLRGTFTLLVAPTSSLIATYDYQYFTDTELTDFINQAADFIGVADPTAVPVGLLDALVFKAGSDACFALSARRAGLYNAGAGGKTAQKGDISKKYKDLAKDLFERAVAERLAFYGQRKGKSSAPSAGSFATKQTPWTPIR